jgi:hypothetical protein
MKKVRFALLASASLFISSSLHAQYADAVIGYNSGSGFHPSYLDPNVALGIPSQSDPYGFPIDPFSAPYATNQIFSIGAGGFLTVQFNTPIQNNPANPFGLDFIIFGHAGFNITNGDYFGGGITDGTFYTSPPGNTTISVSSDGVNFFTLNPSLAPNFDGLFPTDGSGNFQQAVNPSLQNSDFAGLGLAGIRSLYNGSAGGMGYDISWALGTSGLSDISYIRIDGVDGNRFVDAISAVPEPTTWALLGCGMMAFGFSQRRRFAKI